jgi:hypothetical protein
MLLPLIYNFVLQVRNLVRIGDEFPNFFSRVLLTKQRFVFTVLRHATLSDLILGLVSIFPVFSGNI